MLLLALLACVTTGSIDLAPDDTGDTGVTDTDTDPGDTDGFCGEVTVWDMELVGFVHTEGGTPVNRAELTLEDRGWNPGSVLGTAQTDGDGAFRMTIDGLTSVEDCWGIVLDYVLTGEKNAIAGEKGINPFLHAAIQDGTLVADITQVPLILE